VKFYRATEEFINQLEIRTFSRLTRIGEVSRMQTFPSDHVSLVTGASTGIGAAVAKTLAERGSHVAVHFRSNESEANRVVAQIVEFGGRAFTMQADLAETGSAQILIDSVLSKMGHIDVLVNNAGSMVSRRKLLEITDEFWNEVMETNLGSVLRLNRAVAPSMIERRSGAIVNVASVAARNGGSLGIIPYASAKAAVLCMTKGLAKELIQYGIRVNAVNPGVIDTPFHERFTSPEQMKVLVSNIPQGRPGKPGEIASAIAFLVSEDASHIVGETLEVNGGIWMD
jgi:3-oxoacyl-[acyl-carrier protein] reductase